MGMHTPEEWAKHAFFNLSQAQEAQHRAASQIEQSRRTHEGAVLDNLAMYGELHQAMKQKVKTSYKLLDKLAKRAASLDGSMQACKVSLASLEKASRDKDHPMQMCMWRLEQREQKPLREQVHDIVEVALEEEKVALLDVQRKLGEGIAKTKLMIADLQGLYDQVRTDMEHKTQALSVDELCLRNAVKSMHAVVERTPPPASARSPSGGGGGARLHRHQAALMESGQNEVARQHEVERLTRAAASREEAAQAMRDENAKLVQRCDAVALEAQTKSEKRLQERINENQAMRRRLEGEIRETQAKIEHTKNTIAETKHQLKALAEPIELTSSCASWRKQRAAKEHIDDPVSAMLTQHRLTVMKAHQDLLSHHQNEKSMLQELVERRERLREDLRDKTASLHIDLNCLTHESYRPISKLGLVPTSPSRHGKVEAYAGGRAAVAVR